MWGGAWWVGEGSRCRLAARHRHATSRHAGAQAARRTRFSASKLPIRHGTPRAKRPPPPPRGGCVQTMDDDGAGTRGDRPSPTKSAQGRDRGEPRKRFRMTWRKTLWTNKRKQWWWSPRRVAPAAPAAGGNRVSKRAHTERAGPEMVG